LQETLSHVLRLRKWGNIKKDKKKIRRRKEETPLSKVRIPQKWLGKKKESATKERQLKVKISIRR